MNTEADSGAGGMDLCDEMSINFDSYEFDGTMNHGPILMLGDRSGNNMHKDETTKVTIVLDSDDEKVSMCESKKASVSRSNSSSSSSSESSSSSAASATSSGSSASSLMSARGAGAQQKKAGKSVPGRKTKAETVNKKRKSPSHALGCNNKTKAPRRDSDDDDDDAVLDKQPARGRVRVKNQHRTISKLGGGGSRVQGRGKAKQQPGYHVRDAADEPQNERTGVGAGAWEEVFGVAREPAFVPAPPPEGAVGPVPCAQDPGMGGLGFYHEQGQSAAVSLAS